MTEKQNPAPSELGGEKGSGADGKAICSAPHYTPTTTARPVPGDIVSVPGIGRCHVVRDDDPSLLTVQNAQGVEFRFGERSVERLEGRTR